MDHLMDPLTAMIKTLGTPDVTPELKQTIVEGVLREAGNRSVDELAQQERADHRPVAFTLTSGKQHDKGKDHTRRGLMIANELDLQRSGLLAPVTVRVHDYVSLPVSQLTMGLAPLIFYLKTQALRKNDESYNRAARFWAKIFGINFVLGVVTGIPMEFQFGTNWSHFSQFAGGVIGQTLAMEGTFAFFLESAFLGLFLYGEKKLSPKMHWFSSLMVFLGRGYRGTSSLPLTRGCSIRWHTSVQRMEHFT